MNKITKLVIGVFALSFAATTACKKSDSNNNSNTPSTAGLTGTWKFTKQYKDANSNGIMDANELDTSVLSKNATVKFNADGTGIQTFDGQSGVFTWKLINNNTYLQLTDPTSTPADSYLHFESYSSTMIEVRDTSGMARGEASWTYLTKQ